MDLTLPLFLLPSNEVGGRIKLIKGVKERSQPPNTPRPPTALLGYIPLLCANGKLLQPLITKEMRDHPRTQLLIHLENVSGALVPIRPEINMQRSCLTFALE